MPSQLARPAGAAIALASALLAGCAPMPVAPTVAVMPGANKPFEVFMQDDQLCRGWAANSVGQPGNNAAANQFVGSTVAGAVIGGLLGAAVGDHRSAGVGAAMGTVVGSSVGANQSAATSWNAQRSYDIAYQQCMYSKGNVLPQRYGYAYPYPYPPPPPPR
ncbi:MAG TPA: YMGG-like glycine zipper-containing protein [Ramlibacter sp.]|nr:YMGG-like glycine zipper-containing protein [Ramlibacter sp.]